jgi:hypothetical protein
MCRRLSPPQAEAAESASVASSRAFVAQAKKTVSDVSLGAALRVANSAQFVTDGSSKAELKRFGDAGFVAETLVRRAVTRASDRGCFAEGRRCDVAGELGAALGTPAN